MRFAILLFVLALAPTARSGMVTIHFGGEVTGFELGEVSDLPAVSIGDPFSGSYSYDDSITRDPFSGVFLFPESNPLRMTVTVAGTNFDLDGTHILGRGFISMNRESQYLPPRYRIVGSSWDDDRGYSHVGVIDLQAEVLVPISGVLGDAPLPEFPSAGGRFELWAPPDHIVSEERILAGVHPGGIPIMGVDPENPRGPRIQVATRFPAIRATGSRLIGHVTSWSVPEPGGLALAIPAFSFAVRRRSARRAV